MPYLSSLAGERGLCPFILPQVPKIVNGQDEREGLKGTDVAPLTIPCPSYVLITSGGISTPPLPKMVDEMQQKKHTAEDILQMLCNVLKSMLGG